MCVAVHHKATGCPADSPRKLVRTTVSNDVVPMEKLSGKVAALGSATFDLKLDRINGVSVGSSGRSSGEL